MNGCVLPYTPIAVDFWKVRQCPRAQLFFLSHVHLEPSCGITSSWSLPIYCSSISKKLLIHQFQLNPDIVHELELGVPHSIALTPAGDVTMTVTLIDANHCPGSVMFLFDGYFGRILYTGDFRYNESMLANSGPFDNPLKSSVDVLYLDNTFCSQKCVFPPHDEALKSIITIVEQHPNSRVMFGMRSLGKEDMLIALSERFNEKIAVSSERYKVLELLGMHERFVVCSDELEAKPRFEVVSLVEVTRSNVDAWNKSAPTIAILPTALFEGLGFQPFVSSSDIFVVPYSDHSPFAELYQFVSGIRPKSVIPIVRADVSARDDPLAESLLDRANVECFADCLDRTPMQNYHIPASVLEMMNQTSEGRQSKKRKSCNGNGRQRCRRVGSSQIPEEGTKVEQQPAHSSRTTSVSSDNLESSLSEAADIVRANGGCESAASLHRNKECASSVSTDVHRGTHVLKPHVMVRPMKRCSSSDRLLALAIRPPPHILKQRLNRLAASSGSAGISHSTTTIPQSCMRPKSTINSIGPVFGLVRGRRDKPPMLQHRFARCHGTTTAASATSVAGATAASQVPQLPVHHTLELNRGEETKFVYTDLLLMPTECSPHSIASDVPLNLSQSVKTAVPVDTDIYVSAASNSSENYSKSKSGDYVMFNLSSSTNSSTSAASVSIADMQNCDSAAIAVSSLLSLSNVDSRGLLTQPFAYVPINVGTHLDSTQSHIAMASTETWQSSVAAETASVGAAKSIDSCGFERPVNLTSLMSITGSSLQDSQLNCVASEQCEERLTGSSAYRETRQTNDFQMLNQQSSIPESTESVTEIACFESSRSLPTRPSRCVDSVLPDEPHDYSMTSTTITDSFCQILAPTPDSISQQLTSAAAFCSQVESSKVDGETESVANSKWNVSCVVLPADVVSDIKFLRTSSVTSFESDTLSNCSEGVSSDVRFDCADVGACRVETTGSGASSTISSTSSIAGVMLPPKKNWRRRYHRTSQLNRAHQENKRIHLVQAADSERADGRRSPAVKRPHSRAGRSDTIDGKNCVPSSDDTVGCDAASCDGVRPAKRLPLVASHSVHHPSICEMRSHGAEKSVLTSNPANQLRDSVPDDVGRIHAAVGCLASISACDTRVKKRVHRGVGDNKAAGCQDMSSVCKAIVSPSVTNNKQTYAGADCAKITSLLVAGALVNNALPLDLSAYQKLS